MDESRLRVGSKIKIISKPVNGLYKEGDIGFLVANTVFHDKGNLKDRDGQYWADFKHPEYRQICLSGRKPPYGFKVLKY